MGIQKTVYFVRHGESLDNVAPVFQGPDSPLSENGKQQAGRIANHAVKIPFQAIISSTYCRAKETAQVIGLATGTTVELSNLFIELVKPTSIDGRLFTDADASRIWRTWEESLYMLGKRVENGENYGDLVQRADKALAYLRDRLEKEILVVSHGYFLRCILARVMLGNALTPEAFRNLHRTIRMQNTGITVLNYQDGFEEEACWRLWVHNDHAHLG